MKNGIITFGLLLVAAYCLGGLRVVGYTALAAAIILLIKGK